VVFIRAAQQAHFVLEYLRNRFVPDILVEELRKVWDKFHIGDYI
jgi:DNA-binding protein